MAADLVGRRVVLRRRAGQRDGRAVFTDVLGELVEAGSLLVIRRADGSTVSVPRAEVHRLRAVPPSRAQILALEEVAARAWPAPEVERMGGWLLRAGQGWTRRANSAALLGEPGMPLVEALHRVQRWYGARGLPPRLTVPLPAMAAADRLAERLGWVGDLDVDVLTGPVTAGAPDPGVRHTTSPDAAWVAHYRGGDVPPVGLRILTAPETVTFAALVEPEGTAAIGRGVVTDGWLGIFAMWVRPDLRRRGIGGRMLRALLAWGAGHGATRAYLQVEPRNAGAIALYAAAGFSAHHRYRTRHSIGYTEQDQRQDPARP